jgi:hypothetical protein
MQRAELAKGAAKYLGDLFLHARTDKSKMMAISFPRLPITSFHDSCVNPLIR